MDNARLGTIKNTLNKLPLEDYAFVLMMLSNRLATVSPDAANYCERAQNVCAVELAGNVESINVA